MLQILLFYILTVISWLNRRLADSQSPLQNTTAAATITVPSSIQLTLPRTNKLISNKYETRTPAPNTVQSNALSGLPLRNPIIQNPNINQTTRMTARSMGVGITDNTIGISTFTKSGVSSTSTPMERINSLNKLPGNVAGSSSMPAIVENNNSSVPLNGTKTKSTSITLQGGLRRAGLSDKPILPSAYFPKTLH